MDVVVIPWEPEEYQSVVWGDIGYGMSRPIQPEDSGLSYVPTQIIAECLRDHGVDGIAYGSLLAKGGVNVALFNTKAADLTSCGLMETSAIQFTFGQSDNPYFSTATKKSVTPA